MAKKDKKGKKAKDTDARVKVKFKIPKDIGGVKIPKELRAEGEKLFEAIRGAMTAQATAAAFAALARLNETRRHDGPRNGSGRGC